MKTTTKTAQVTARSLNESLLKAGDAFVSAADPFAALAMKIQHLPIRIFHGDADETVPMERIRRWCGAESVDRKRMGDVATRSAPVRVTDDSSNGRPANGWQVGPDTLGRRHPC